MATSSYGLAPEPVSGDSLTQYLRSVTNTLGTGGQQTFGSGQQTFQQGVQDFGPALKYWNDILSGNKSSMESAIAPEKSDILSQYRARRRNLAATSSRSGGTNEAVANSEFSEAGDVASLLQKLRPQAAKESAGIAGQIGQLGLSESELGNQQLFNALQGLLTRRGQNAATDQSNLANLTSGLETVFSTLI